MALDASGDLYASTNSGAAWTLAGLIKVLGGIACSADGTRMYAAAFLTGGASNGSIYASTDFGATWAPTAAPQAAWGPVACSADGSTVIAAQTSNVWISASAGAGFRLGQTLVPPYLAAGDSATCASLACSANAGTVIAGVADGGYNYVGVAFSTNAGTNWTWGPEANALMDVPDDWGFVCWGVVCCSADGSRMAALGNGGPYDLFTGPVSGVALSSDSGATWVEAPALPLPACAGLATSADGCALASVCLRALTSQPSTNVVATLRSVPAPSLAMDRSLGGLAFSWTIPSVSLVLQQNPDLGTTNWTSVPGSPALDYSTVRYRLTIPLPVGPMFYRLVSQ